VAVKPEVSQWPEGRYIFAYEDLSVKNNKPRDQVKMRGIHGDNIYVKLFGLLSNCLTLHFWDLDAFKSIRVYRLENACVEMVIKKVIKKLAKSTV